MIATGRSDYPNQINNVLAFPGMFRGALDVRASEINEQMELAAGHAIAAVVRADELSRRVHRAERLQPRRRTCGGDGCGGRSRSDRRRSQTARHRLKGRSGFRAGPGAPHVSLPSVA